MNTETKEVAIKQSASIEAAFSSMANFEIAQRMARALSESDLVPKIYYKNVANCIVALEIAQRCQASVLMVMQNLYVIQGRPSWSSQYIIAALNACGRFSPLRFKMEDNNQKCTAFVTELESGVTIEGPSVSIAMAKQEGWYDKNGSKWKTMPELMLRYRAAAFFGRLYAPEVLMGLKTREEEEDIIETTGKVLASDKAADLSAKLAGPLGVDVSSGPPKMEKEVKSELKAEEEFLNAVNATEDPRLVK